MERLPTHILIVTCTHPKKDRELSEILTEYLESLPHIKYEGHRSYPSKTCYIIQVTSSSCDMLKKMGQIIDIRSVLAYDIYRHILSNPNAVYLKHYWVDSFNDRYMPYTTEIPSEDIPKLIAIT